METHGGKLKLKKHQDLMKYRFNVKNRPLYVNFTPLCKIMFFSWFNTSHGYEILLTSTKLNLKPLNSYLFQKMVFWAPKTLLYPLSRTEKAFFSNFEPYDFANAIEWMCGHVNIQVSSKILLEVLKKALILYNPTCFQEGLFWGNLDSMRPLVFRV